MTEAKHGNILNPLVKLIFDFSFVARLMKFDESAEMAVTYRPAFSLNIDTYIMSE